MSVQDEIREALTVLWNQKQRVARAKAHDKIDAQKNSAQGTLLLDELGAARIDVNTRQGQMVLKILVARRLSKSGGDAGYKAEFSFDEPGGGERGDW
jgi:hypothetical protein